MAIPTRSFFARITRCVAAIAGTGLAAAVPATAQSVSPAQAPAEWVAYAEEATLSITAWLQAESDAAVRLRGYLEAIRPAPETATAPLVLKIWIERDGAISRLVCPPLAHVEANADLRALIVGRRLPSSPPEDMLLPLRIAVQLESP